MVYSDDFGETLCASSLVSPDIQAVFPGKGGVVLASTVYYGLIRSTDHGLTWGQSMYTNGTVTAIVRLAGGDLLANVRRQYSCTGVSDTSWGAYRSGDEGLSWIKVGTVREQTLSLVLHPSGALFAGTDTGVYRSNDEGKTWNLAGFASTWVSGLSASSDGWVFAVLGDKGFFRSSNAGVNWENVVWPNALQVNNVFSGPRGELVISGFVPNLGLNSTQRSTDHGSTWLSMNVGAAIEQLWSLGPLIPDGYLGIASFGGCAWSRATGQWSPLPTEGLPEFYLNGLVQGQSGFIYAWSWWGLYRTTSPLTSIMSKAPDIVGGYRLEQNYPNPFNGSTLVVYQVSGVGSQASGGGSQSSVSSWVRLGIYDILGREVGVLVDGKKAPGRYEARWEAAGVPSGIYICRMTAGQFAATKKMILLK